MPSLRRSPTLVRSSPYSRSSNTPATAPRTRKRSSRSNNATRRVLADIEWWRVVDGQSHHHPDLPIENYVYPTFPTLYLTPHTPTRRHNNIDTSPLELIRLGIEDLDLHSKVRPSTPSSPLVSIHIHTFPFTSLSEKLSDYADFTLSPLSSCHPDFLN
jgi:hypothetical protein